MPRRSLGRLYRDGAVVNILNPKAALFFLAFLPQFVVPSRGAVGLQFGLLGLLFVAIAVCTDVRWAVVASSGGAWLRRHPRFIAFERYVAGTVYLGLGLASAMASSRRT
jgi:threonine/homoserine/homoserine lactone efflux protein